MAVDGDSTDAEMSAKRVSQLGDERYGPLERAAIERLMDDQRRVVGRPAIGRPAIRGRAIDDITGEGKVRQRGGRTARSA